MDTNSHFTKVKLNVYQYQCQNDGSVHYIFQPFCPHCGYDNSRMLYEESYYERLYAHLSKIDPEFNRLK